MDEDELWIQEQQKILNIKMNYKREPLEYINLHFCYVDAENAIVNLKTEKYTFSETQTITEAQLFSIIEEKKHDANINYIFSELSLFVVDVEPENIQSIEPTGKPFFKSLCLCPRICKSRVRTRAEHLATLARSIRRSIKPRSFMT